MKPIATFVDGNLKAQLSLQDRGLRYGDGVFETIRVVDGHIPLLKPHLTRLFKSLARLNISLARSTIIQSLKAAELYTNTLSGVVRLTVTRGSGGRGYLSEANIVPCIILEIYEGYPDKPPTASVHSCDIRLANQHQLAGIKTLSALTYVLASEERRGKPFDEGLLFNEDDQLIEATSHNIFIVNKSGSIATPQLNQCGVAGVMRAKVIALLKKTSQLMVEETAISKSMLSDSKEVFLTNSVIGVWPVTSWYDKKNVSTPSVTWPIGDLTQGLRQDMNHYLQKRLSTC